MIKNRIEEAGTIAISVGKAIARTNKADLRKVSECGNPRQLWKKANELTKVEPLYPNDNGVTANALNSHCAAIFTNPEHLTLADLSKFLSSQGSSCLRYVSDGTTTESFIRFYTACSTEGESLYTLVNSVLQETDLVLKDIVSEGFDGAANMRGVHHGLAI